MKKTQTLDLDALPRTLAHLVAKGGDAPAVISFNHEGQQVLTYAQLHARAGRLAAGLRATNNKQKDRKAVLLFAPPSPDAVIAIVATLRAGLILVPIDTQMPDQDLEGVLKSSGASMAITTQELGRRLQAVKGGRTLTCYALDASKEDKQQEGFPSLDTLQTDDPAEPATMDPDATAIIFYTSGTTGLSKGVPLSHRNILFQFKTAVGTGLLTKDDRMLLPLPIHHVYPMVIALLTPLAMGIAVVLPASLSGKALSQAMREGGASIMMGVPRLYTILLDAIREKAGNVAGGRLLFATLLGLARMGNRCHVPIGRWLFRPLRRQVGPSLRLLSSGGSPLDPDLARSLEAMGWQIAVGYGLTETAPLLTARMPGEKHYASVGRAVQGVDLRLDHARLPEGDRDPETGATQQQGELLARGPNVFSGYQGEEQQTQETFTADGWFRTGDIAHIDEDGYVYLNGRVSTQIALQGGENINPEHLEAQYTEMQEIKEIGILEFDGKLAALVVPEDELVRDEGQERATKTIREALQARGKKLPSYARLSQVEIVAGPLARTTLGKLRRNELQAAFEAATQRDDGGPAAGTPMPVAEMSTQDQMLLENPRARTLWDFLAKRYADQRLTLDSHLEFDLGIDSLGWVELSMAIENATGARVDDQMIAQTTRLRDLLTAVAEAPDKEEGKRAEPLAHPESVLDEKEQRWAAPRGPVSKAIALMCYGLVRLYMRLAHRIKVEGLANLPDGPYILTPNHVSYLDPLALGAVLGRRRALRVFWAGRSTVLFKNFVLRMLSRVAQVVPIDERRGPFSSLAYVALVCARKHPLVLFPEGHVSQDGKLRAFQPGIGLLLLHQDLQAVPVFIQGTYDALPMQKRWPRCRHISVQIGKPQTAKDLGKGKEQPQPEDITAALRKKIAALQNDAESQDRN